MKAFRKSVVLLAVFLPLAASGQNPKKIYIANDCHTDYMWATDEAGYS